MNKDMYLQFLKVFTCDDASMLEGAFDAWVKAEHESGYAVDVLHSNLTAVYGHGKLVFAVMYSRTKVPKSASAGQPSKKTVATKKKK